MPRRTPALALLAAGTVLAACGDDGPGFGLPEPASAEGERIRDLWQVFNIVALVVAAIVWGLIGYALVRYRRRNDDLPSQKPYNLRFEVAYTVVPLAVVAGLFAFTQAVEPEVTGVDDDAAVVVEVVGFQWQWRFSYPEEGITLVGTPEGGPPELVLPVGETVRFDLVASDVAHSFWVPALFEKRDLVPGLENQLDLTPTRTGTFPGRCAEFCGLQHWSMTFSVRVVEPGEYESWIEEMRSDA